MFAERINVETIGPSYWYSRVFEGLGGLSHGSFFRIDDSIDPSKPPGVRTSATITKANATRMLLETARKIVTGYAFCYSPNLTWFLLSVVSYCAFPYDLEPKKEEDAALFQLAFERLWINFGLGVSYIAFWHLTLYWFHFCDRPFVPNRVYNTKKVFHNLFYTVLGILQWTVTEAGFLHLYRSNKIPYATILSSSSGGGETFSASVFLQTLLLSVAVPPFRDTHFYFAHRLIHVRWLYKYVHSLHHRNTDIEPFSGLSMHPVEHMYYYTCYGPLLVLPFMGYPVHPFLVFWIGAHCVISPAASHSGYEDHFQADLHHYLHHRFCECNYSGGINFDAYFGTCRDSLPPPTMKEECKNEKNDNNPASMVTTTTTIVTEQRESEQTNATPEKKLLPPPADRKSSLVGDDGSLVLPEYPLYQLGTYSMVFGSIYARYQYRLLSATTVAVLATVGPAVWAFILMVQTAPKSMKSSSWRKLCLSPFDKDSVSSLFLHFGLGTGLGVLPATYLLYLVLA